MSLKSLERKIYIIYLICMPLTLISPLWFLRDIFGEIASGTSFVIHLLGLILVLIRIIREREIKINYLIRYLFYMILILNISSILMAIVLNNKLGILHGEDTYKAIYGMVINYSHVFIVFYYNYYGMRIISRKDIEKVINIIITYSLIIGYIQIIILNIPYIGNLYDSIDFLNILGDSSFILAMDRITVTASEPAGVGGVVTLICLPYLIAKSLSIISNKNIIVIILFLPIIYLTKSSTVYILFFTNIIIWLYFIGKRSRFKLKNIIFSLISAIIILSFFIINNDNLDEINKTIKYYSIEKIEDNKNQSTLYRKSTVINDINVFKRYPILGVGNGNQGFFYNKNFRIEYFLSQEATDSYYGKNGVLNGGAFVPAYISGYGILGVILLVLFIKKGIKQLKFNDVNCFYKMYIIGGITFFTMACMSSDIVGNYIAIFIFSLPFLEENNSNYSEE